jgi:hypothetical protein
MAQESQSLFGFRQMVFDSLCIHGWLQGHCYNRGRERERGGGEGTILLQLQANALLHVSDQCPDDDK